MEMALYRNNDTGDIYEGPDTARAMLAHGGWVLMSDQDAADYRKAERDKELGVDQAMLTSAQLDPSLATPETSGDGTTDKENG